MDNQDRRAESTESAATTNSAENNFIQMALAQCWPGGPIVSNPADCKDIDRDTWRRADLPNLQLTDNNAAKPQHS